MPPRFAYWTIILDNVPTSFRTKDREEILPLFNQLKAKNPGALLKWFSGGRLWDSPEQAREVRDVEKVRRFRDERAKETKEQRELEEREMRAFREKHGRAGDDSGAPSTPPHDQNRPEHGRGMTRNGPEHPFRTGKPERRGRDWRPGGDHSDPRDKYKLPPGEARKRWKERNLPSTRPGDDRSLRTGGPGRPRGPKPFGSKPGGEPSTSLRPGRPFGSKPGGDRPYGDRPRGPKPFGSKPGGGPSTSLRPGRPYGAKPGGDRSFGNRPGGPPPTRDGGKRPLRPGRPFGGKPKGPGGPRRKG
jgi:23S rRNA pseudouridine2605 synthase